MTMTRTTYEFTPEQNLALTGLAGRMWAVGGILMVVALLILAESTALVWKGTGSAVGFEVGAILLLIGFWSIRASGQFLRVVRTEGADISHLMDGLREIRKLYELQFWAFVVLSAMVALALFAVLAGAGRLHGPYP